MTLPLPNVRCWLRFLNSSQSEVAHLHAGITMTSLVSQLWISAVVCLVQFLLFNSLRTRFPRVYDPRGYRQASGGSLHPPGVAAWCRMVVVELHLPHYRELGLDAYFFMRYLRLLILIFSGFSITLVPVLVPLNWIGATPHQVRGLDKLSWASVSPNNIHRLSVHLGLGLGVVVAVQMLILRELRGYIRERQAQWERGDCPRVVVVDRIPSAWDSEEAIRALFSLLPGGVCGVWMMESFGRVQREVSQVERCLRRLETHELAVISIGMVQPLKRSRILSFTSLRALWVRVLHLGGTAGGRMMGEKPSTETLVANLLSSRKRLALERQQSGIFPYRKAVIEFGSPMGASLARQCLLSEHPHQMRVTDMGLVALDGLVWETIRDRSSQGAAAAWTCLAHGLGVGLIICWVVPVSFVSMLSYPYLTRLIPALSFLTPSATGGNNLMAEVLPTVVTAVLLEAVSSVMRRIARLRGPLLHYQVELDTQRWLFAFLFVNLFLVVTIASSVTALIQDLINSPVSVPTLLATNFPKAANFFYSYFILRGMSYFGVNLLRVNRLLLLLGSSFLWNQTPRAMEMCRNRLQRVRWGSTYPFCTVYACIGLVYSVISPLLSVFCLSLFCFYYLYFKWLLRHVFDDHNPAETDGRLYPVALLQLYTGLYCLELCLLGLFLLAKDSTGSSACLFHAGVMVVSLVGTVITNAWIATTFHASVQHLPLTIAPRQRQPTGGNSYQHPSHAFVMPLVRLPRDPRGISKRRIARLGALGVEATDDGCTLEGDLSLHLHPTD